MKVRGKDNELAQEAVKIQKQQAEGVATRRSEAEGNPGRAVGLARRSEDTVNVSLGKAISEQLNQIEAKKNERFEEIKRLVQSGQYNPPINEVAQAVGEDIVFEILTASNE
jgi:anti-sigma28 factor (negative regulator of flagellin synthesis)